MNAFRFLDYKSFDEVDNLLIDEYILLMKAHRYKQVDRQFDIHQQAYLNHVVKGTKTIGKSERSLYPTFEDFYNYEGALDNIENPEKEDEVDSVKMKMLNINTRINSSGGE